MPMTLDPLRPVLISVVGWMNQHQQRAIECLREENRYFGHSQVTAVFGFTDHQRCSLAATAKLLKRRLLAKVTTATRLRPRRRAGRQLGLHRLSRLLFSFCKWRATRSGGRANLSPATRAIVDPNRSE
jgi:hypothetical protein